jgi:hypothetical protein
MRALQIPLALFVLCAPALAFADGEKGRLASVFALKEDVVTEAITYRLAGVTDYTEVIVGTYTEHGRDQHIVAFLRCGARTCTTVARAWIGPYPFRLLGLADLNGKPGPLSGARDVKAQRSWEVTLSGPTKKLRWPVLVVETQNEAAATGETRWGRKVSGTERHNELLLFSLRKSEARGPQIVRLPTADTYASGAGTTASYSLARGTRKDALDIVGSELRHLDNDSHCMAPKPVEVRYVYKDGRYTRVDSLSPVGCH